MQTEITKLEQDLSQVLDYLSTYPRRINYLIDLLTEIQKQLNELKSSNPIYILKKIEYFADGYRVRSNNDLDDLGEWEVYKDGDGYKVEFEFYPDRLEQIIQESIEEFVLQLSDHLREEEEKNND